MRAAISLVLSENISKNSLISRFFKGVFRLRPIKPKYDRTWDMSIVLKEIETWWPLESLDLTKLTYRLVMLLALSTAQRRQTLAAIKLSNIKRLSDRYEIEIADLMKTSRPGTYQPLLTLPIFRENPQLCVVRTLEMYLTKTSPLRKEIDNLFLTTRQPHGPASPDSLSRWLRTVLTTCGISSEFSAHSTRHASTSAAMKKGVSVEIIKKAAGWSEKSRVFTKHYLRAIETNEEFLATAIFES